MACLQIILAMILTEICIFKKSSTQVLAQISYPVFPLVQGYNNLPLYQPAAAVAYSPVQPMAPSQLLTNHALNLRKQKLYRNFMLNRALRQKGLISREKYLRNMKQNEETYRQILKQMYQAERNAQQYDWDNIPIRSTPTTTTAPASSKIPKYQKFKIKFKNGKNKGFTLSQFVPNEIIPVMRSVPNPDSINNAIVNLAQTEPLREKIMNQQLRRPANSLESGEYLDTFRKHKHSGNTAQVQTDTIDVSSLRGDIGRKLQPFEDASKENFETQPFGFQGISLEEIKNRRVSQNRIRHDERKKYSTKISANQGDVQSTEVVEGELFPIQLQGAPVYKKPGESPQHRGQTGNTVPEIRANMFLADQNGIMHKIRDNMVPHELGSSKGPVYQPYQGSTPGGSKENNPPETEEMSRIADSLVSKYKQYQALQKLIHAEKPTRSSSTSTAKYNFNATLSTTPNYGQLLTFNLAEFIQANTSPPPPSHSPLDRIRLSLLHKSPLSESTPLPGERATGVGDSKIRELAQRIIAMKKSELDASRSSTVAPEFSKETEWTPLIPSATDHVSKLPRNHRTDYNGDQYVEIYTKDRLTRLSTLAKKNDTSIVYAKSAPS